MLACAAHCRGRLVVLGMLAAGLLVALFAGTARGQGGLCCFASGACIVGPPSTCPASPTAFYVGGCLTCDITPCQVQCCADNGTCTLRTYNACIAAQGNPVALLGSCGPLPACPFAVGSCCQGSLCTLRTRIQCDVIAGAVFQGLGTTCNDFCAPPLGACCRAGQCVMVSQLDCGEHHWNGPLTVCHRLIQSCCRADYNKSGFLDVQDIFGFLAAWFISSSAADFNENCHDDVQDIFIYLAEWFAGCP